MRRRGAKRKKRGEEIEGERREEGKGDGRGDRRGVSGAEQKSKEKEVRRGGKGEKRDGEE